MRPGAFGLAMQVKIDLRNGPWIDEPILALGADEIGKTVAGEGAIDYAIDDDMRDMNAFRAELACQSLCHGAQGSLC